MIDGVRHFDDEIQDALDHRLDAVAEAALRAHLLECPRCRSLTEALSRAKREAVSLGHVDVPPGLEAAVRAALPSTGHGRPGAGRTARVKWALPAIAAIVLAAWGLLFVSRADAPSAAAQDYRAYVDGRLSLAVATAEAGQLESFFLKRSLGFRARVLDLQMMGYRLIGGTEHRIAGRTSVLLVYRRGDGHTVVCQMFAGRLSELPAPDESRDHGGFTFRVYRRDGLTLAFWQEGEVVCVLVAGGDSEALVRLAFAKAMRAGNS